MEHCSQAGCPLSASAQRIVAALRAQYADRVAQRRHTGETGGAMLRRSQESSWSRTQSLTTGDQRGAGRSWSRGHLGDHLYTEGIRDGASLEPHRREDHLYTEGIRDGASLAPHRREDHLYTEGIRDGASLAPHRREDHLYTEGIRDGASLAPHRREDHLYTEGIRDGASLAPHRRAPELSWSRTGGGSSAVGVPSSPPEGEGVASADAEAPEGGARELLLQQSDDIIRVGRGEREGPCRGAGPEAQRPAGRRAGPRGGRWQFGRLLLPPWSRASKEGGQEGQGKEGAWPENRLAEEPGTGPVASYGGRAWPASGPTFLLPGDGIKQEADWVETGCVEKLPFRRSLEEDGTIEDAEARRCRQGALLAAVQGGFRVAPPSGREAGPAEMECVRKPAWSSAGAEDQEETCREGDAMSPLRETVQQGDQLVGYREEQAGGYRQEQAGGYRGEQARGYRQEQAGGYREEQAGGYRGEQAGGYRGEQAGGYMEEQAGGYREEQAKEYREEQAKEYREEQAGGYREEQAKEYREEQAKEYREEQAGGYRGEQAGGYRGEQAGGYRGEQAGGYMEEQAGGYREEQAKEYREEQAKEYREEQAGGYREEQAKEYREEQAKEYREEQAGGYREEQAGGYMEDSEKDEIREHTGSRAVCPSLTEGPTERPGQDRPNDTSQVNGTGHGGSSEAAGVDLALEKSCPFSETPARRERTPPAPSTAGRPSPDRPRSPPRRDDTQDPANRAAPLKRRRASPRPRSCGRKRPGRWEPPRPSQERSGGETRTPRPPAPSPARGEGLNAHRVASETPDPQRRHPPRPGDGTQLPKPLGEKRAGRGGGRGLEPQRREEGRESSWAPTSDPAVRDVSRLSREERARVLQEAARAPALVLTMVHQDGSTQLCPLQKSSPSVSGILLLLKGSLDAPGPGEDLGSGDSLLYLRLEQRPAWAQQNQELDQNQDLFTREMVQRVVSAAQVVVCYKAKDLLRTLLQHFSGALSWKQVARCRILDPQIAAWLLDPADSASCFQDLVTKHCGTAAKPPPQPPGPRKASSPSTSLSLLYQLMTDLHSSLQTRGLWDLFSSVEISMIPVLAVMESHRIHVDKEALKRTSEMLGAKLKQLEQDAHKAAGQQFLVSSSAQLRLVLFEKLRLQERCESRKLPKTLLKQHQSTSEAALLQLQDLHPLPRIILEYRQVHKIKSTFVDGILSCVKKTYVSSTWNQTSAVSGRLSAKQPNFQALPRQPVQIIKRQYVPGMQPEAVMVHPRDMFIPQEGHTFLAADFCQVELRLLAHLTSDPELLRLFQDPDADVFTVLASHWKGVPENRLNPEDREHAKRVVYSVVYGAGRERLSGILGVSAEQASRFVDSFLQRYREVHSFIQRTVQQCQKQGYVVSIMGRRRPLPHIHSADWAVRNQAERQAVNFVVQGSAADLCKMAMIRIFSLVSASSSLTPRLLAQIHDELLFEVEDSQLEDFAALVKTTMESLQHIDSLGVHLKVPLKVAVSSGGSWGSMSELRLPPAPPPRPSL